MAFFKSWTWFFDNFYILVHISIPNQRILLNIVSKTLVRLRPSPIKVLSLTKIVFFSVNDVAIAFLKHLLQIQT